MTSTTLINKVGSALNRLNASDRVAYKRVYTRTGGDPLLGQNGTVTVVDTKLNPVPAIFPVTQDSLLALQGATQIQLNDLVMLVASSALSKADLSNKELVIALKTGSAVEEYGIAGYTATPFDGASIVFTALLRSKRRP